MKIVIDIPKEFKEHFKEDRFEDSLARVASDIESFGLLAGRYEQETIIMLRQAIKNVTPLPKGHGRLIDADELKKHKYHDNNRCENAVAVAQIDWADTIIEADKEGD